MHAGRRSTVFLLPTIPSVFACAAAGQAVILVDADNPVPNSTVLPSGASVTVVDGGVIGLNVDLSFGTLSIEGGEVALGATGTAGPSSGFTNNANTVTVSGGRVGEFFQLLNGTSLVQTGGEMSTFGVFGGSTAATRGGVVTGFADVFSGSTYRLEGGEVASFRALTGSTVEIVATSFTFGGAPIDIPLETPMTFFGRGQELVATLADGNVFRHPLLPFDPGFPTPGVALTTSTLRLIRVSAACNPADVDADGALGFGDVVAFIDAFNAGDADVNGDGATSFADVTAFIDAFNAGCP